MKNNNWIAIVLAVVLAVGLLWIVKCQIKEHLQQDDPMLHRLRAVLEPVHPVVKNLRLYKGDKSYTINKEKIFLNLKDPQGEYYPLNMLVYVTLHEISHLINTKDVGHTEEFHRIFDELLLKAAEQGSFNPSIPIIQEYAQE